MPTQHSTKERGEVLDRVDVLYHVSNDDEVELRYDPVGRGETQTVIGTVDDAHLTESTAVITDDGVRYDVMGPGWADREPGEVVKEDENGRRRVGWFDRAYRLE